MRKAPCLGVVLGVSDLTKKGSIYCQYYAISILLQPDRS